jgi:polar amino acid transport system substrate-binding protein
MVLRETSGKTAIPQVTLAALVILVGCGLPRDPEGTLVRARGRTLRIGVSANSPWTIIEGDDVAGIEAVLMRQIADSLDAQIEWVFDSEGDLLQRLEQFEIDAVICGLLEETPW